MGREKKWENRAKRRRRDGGFVTTAPDETNTASRTYDGPLSNINGRTAGVNGKFRGSKGTLRLYQTPKRAVLLRIISSDSFFLRLAHHRIRFGMLNEF